MRIAALDLGSNTFICLIGEGDSSGFKQILLDQVEIVRLGQDVGRTGHFHEEALSRAWDCLQKFKKLIDEYDVQFVKAVATSAARDAKNGHVLFEMGHKLNIPISIIDGSSEAKISYLGSTWGHGQIDGNTLVIDVGGGSTELILGQGPNILWRKSLNIGAVRMTERYISTYPIVDSESEALEKFVLDNLHAECTELLNFDINQAIAVAGTPTSLAALELGGFIESSVNGYIFSTNSLLKWKNTFSRLSLQEIKDKYNLGGRSDIIYAGTSILASVLSYLKLNELTVSTKGVRYGVADSICRGDSI